MTRRGVRREADGTDPRWRRPIAEAAHLSSRRVVEDDGPGIAGEHHERIFDKFFRVEGDKEAKAYGSGIRLAFCKLAAAAQGGRIWVESQEGEGARFSVALDVA